MFSQAGYLKEMVDRLIGLVGGSAGKHTGDASPAAQKPSVKNKRKLRSPRMNIDYYKMAVAKKEEVHPEQIIPLEDDDFRDF